MAKNARLGHNSAQHDPGFRSDRIYTQWLKVSGAEGRMKGDISAGVEPVVSIMMTQAGIKWADVAKGAKDKDIDTMATTFRDVPGPGLIIPQHEPDNAKNRQMVGGKIDWASYRGAAERVATRFRAAGVGKGWRFAVNTTGWDRTVLIPAVFAGAQMMAGDRYNWAFTYHNPTGSRWNTFENECAPTVKAALEAQLPVAVFETNCMEDPSDNERKATWLADAFAYAKAANLRRLIFFEGDPLVRWVVKSSPQAAAALQVATSDPYWVG